MGREVDGGFADLVAVDDRQLLALPSSMSLPDAAMLQVLGVCVHAQRRVNVFPGQTAAVIGLGVGGLLHTQLLTARGVRVVGITRSSGKQELAESLGAVVACGPDEAVECIGDVTDGRGVDVVVESVGTTETLAQAIDLVTVGGTVLQYGILAATEGRLPFYELYYKEIDLVNSRAAVPGDYAASIDLVASGQVEVASLISETYTLEQGADAFDAMHSRSDLIKVLLEIG